MVSCHVVESCVIKYVGITYDGGVAWWEIAGILLNDGGVMVEGKGNPDAKGEQGGGEAPNATKGVNCSESRWKRWCCANGDPDIGWGDVEESEACGGQCNKEVEGKIGGRGG